MVKKLLLDMDPGIDDALALFAAHHSGHEIMGVCTLAGNLPLKQTTANASGLLASLGNSALVYKGASMPLHRKLEDASAIHGSGGLGNWHVDLDPSRVSPIHAAQYIAQVARNNPGEVTLVATGPLTNLALALEYYREDVLGLAKVVFMGGALTRPGNVTPAAEFNIWADPEAAAVVFASGLDLTMVGLDVTQKVCLTKADVDELASSTSAAQSIPAMVGYYLDRYDEFPLHDPLALLAAVHPEYFRFQHLPIKVETRGELTRGQTIADFSGRQAWESRFSAALDVEVQSAKTMLMDLWTR